MLGTRYLVLIDHSLIRNLESSIDNLKRLAQLLLIDAQRRVSEESIPAHEGVEALLTEEAAERGHFVRGAVERSQGLARFAIANQFDDAEQSNRAHRADGGMLRLQIFAQRFHDRAHLLRTREW